MGSPYGIHIEWYLYGTESKIYHDMEGPDFVPSKSDVVYLNEAGYEVENTTLHISDKYVTNPETGEETWFITKVLYKVYMSEIDGD